MLFIPIPFKFTYAVFIYLDMSWKAFKPFTRFTLCTRVESPWSHFTYFFLSVQNQEQSASIVSQAEKIQRICLFCRVSSLFFLLTVDFIVLMRKFFIENEKSKLAKNHIKSKCETFRLKLSRCKKLINRKV